MVIELGVLVILPVVVAVLLVGNNGSLLKLGEEGDGGGITLSLFGGKDGIRVNVNSGLENKLG